MHGRNALGLPAPVQASQLFALYLMRTGLLTLPAELLKQQY